MTLHPSSSPQASPAEPPAKAPESELAKMRGTFQAVGLVGAALTLAALGFSGGRSALGVVVGCALALANLYAFARLVEAMLNRRAKGWAVISVIKVVALFGLVAWLIRNQLTTAITFVVGYTSLPLGITLSSLWGSGPEPTKGLESTAGNKSVS
jgi:hypothetical protein